MANGAAPVLSVRLQEVFGLSETPKVNGGKMPVVMHLLSPGYKPVQVTSDLKSFWNILYFEVKKELQRRYPKHAWPDDPWTAPAVAKGRSTKK
jgi:ATP-dependent helicase HrpB